MSLRLLGLGIVAATSFALASASCADTTQVTLVITTSAPCVASGAPGPVSVDTDIFISSEAQSANASTCTPNQPNNDIGTLVLLPGPSGQALVRIVATLDVNKATVAKCEDDLAASIANPSCIEAKRSVSFIQHRSLRLPINIDSKCAGVLCKDGSETCIDGICEAYTTDCTQNNTCTTFDAGAPDVNVADTSVRDTSVPDTSVADAGPPAIPISIVAAGDATCVVTQGKRVQCWGYSMGAMGDPNTYTKVLVPTDIGLADVTQLSMGVSHSCAVVSTSGYCFGANGSFESAPASNIAVYATSKWGNVTQVAVGDHHSCVLDTMNNVPRVMCWGDYSLGQLGPKAVSNQPTPMVFNQSDTPVSIASGANHICAGINGKSKGEVFCWGDTTHGQSGGTNPDGNYVAMSAMPIVGTTLLVAGVDGSFAVTNGGNQWWGDDTNGQLSAKAVGDGKFNMDAKLLAFNIKGIQQAAVGVNHSCAAASNTLWCWGSGDAVGGIPQGKTTEVNVQPIKAVTAVAVGTSHTCAIAASTQNPNRATVYCFGDDSMYQLGDNNKIGMSKTPSTTTPVELTLASE